MGLNQMKRLLLIVALVCGNAVAQAAMRLNLLEEGSIAVAFVAEADTLSHEAPLVGTLEVTSLATEEVTIPDLRERFQGFTFVEDFAAGRADAGGKARTRWRFRLTPSADGPWCLRPFVMTVKQTRTGDVRKLLTRRVEFPAPLALPQASGSPEANLEPEWVAPGWRTIGSWILWVVGIGGAIAGLWPLVRRIRRTLHERTLSPEARARLELDRLLAENLLAQGQFKRFYYGLTGVVRRYFERGYALRATRQTTQEFLNVIASDVRVSAEERTALAQFLTAADAIKFAGITATATEAEAATSHVRELLAQAAAHRSQIESAPSK
jgi:hypothetical protein